MTRPVKAGQTEQQLVREQIETALDKVDARIAEARERADRSHRDRNQLRLRIGPRPALPAPAVPVPVALAPEETTATQGTHAVS